MNKKLPPFIIVQEIAGYMELSRIVRSLPDALTDKTWNNVQNSFLRNRREFWMWIATRLEYLQFIQLGYLAEDPVVKMVEPWSNQVKIYSDYYFQLLQVIIQEWERIKQTALDKGKFFRFNNPRELLAQVCREEALFPFTICLIKSGQIGIHLDKTRKEEAFWSKVYRGSKTLDKSSLKDKYNRVFISPSWYRFPATAVCYKLHKDIRNSKPYWKDFCKAHKALCQHLKNKTDNLWWHYGYPTDSKGKPIREFENSFWREIEVGTW